MRGAVVGDDVASRLSLLSAGGTSQWLRRGQRVGDYRLLHVSGERAWVVHAATERAYAVCQIELSARAEVVAASRVVERSPAKPNAGLPLAHLNDKIEERGVNAFVMDRSVMETLVEQQGALAAMARAQPDMQDGRTVGLTIQQVRAGSVLEKMGLRSGDRLRRAAGVDLTSIEEGLTALARLRSSQKFSIDVIRNGTPTRLDFEIR